MNLRSSFLAALLLMGMAASAQAGFIDNVQSSPTGIQNTFVDSSFEAIIYTDSAHGTNGIQVGDTVVGYTQINSMSATNGYGNSTTMGNTLYAIFSETVTSINGATGGTAVSANQTGGIGYQLGATTGTYSLQNLIGSQIPTGKAIDSSAIFTLFDVPNGSTAFHNYSANPGSQTTLSGILSDIAKTGTYEVSGGISGSSDFLAVNLNIPGGPSPQNQDATPTVLAQTTNQFASYQGGLSVLNNYTGLQYGLVPLTGFGNYQLVVKGGTASGVNAAGATFNPNTSTSGINGSLVLALQSGNTYTSNLPVVAFTDTAKYEVDAISPEPSSIILFGFGIGGLGVGYLRKRKMSVAM